MWWDWLRWGECGQELGALDSKVPAGWTAAAREKAAPRSRLALSRQRSKPQNCWWRGWDGGRVMGGIHHRWKPGELSAASAGQALHVAYLRTAAAGGSRTLFVAEALGRARNSPWVTAAEEMQRLTQTGVSSKQPATSASQTAA
jgi:hypothetical protein